MKYNLLFRLALPTQLIFIILKSKVEQSYRNHSLFLHSNSYQNNCLAQKNGNVITFGGIFLNKRIASAFISLMIISLHWDMPVAAEQQGTVTENNVTVRRGPGTDFQKIAQTNEGDTYTVTQQQSEWVEIQLDNGAGWIHTNYINIDEVAITPTKITIPNPNTQIRSGPSTDDPISHFADKGSTFNVISSGGDWYEIKNEAIHGYIYKSLTKAIPNSSKSNFTNKSIVIDAGHGGRDVGAIGATETLEKDVTFLTAQELKKELTMLGADVRLTRPRDDFIPLNSRISYSNNFKTDVFISLHYNSVPGLPNVTGIESYYFQDNNQDLASLIQKGLINATQSDDRGTSFGDYLVLRQNMKSAILIELGFISNQAEESRLQTTMYQKQLVSGIIQGLGAYFANYK